MNEETKIERISNLLPFYEGQIPEADEKTLEEIKDKLNEYIEELNSILDKLYAEGANIVDEKVNGLEALILKVENLIDNADQRLKMGSEVILGELSDKIDDLQPINEEKNADLIMEAIDKDLEKIDDIPTDYSENDLDNSLPVENASKEQPGIGDNQFSDSTYDEESQITENLESEELKSNDDTFKEIENDENGWKEDSGEVEEFEKKDDKDDAKYEIPNEYDIEIPASSKVPEYEISDDIESPKEYVDIEVQAAYDDKPFEEKFQNDEEIFGEVQESEGSDSSEKYDESNLEKESVEVVSTPKSRVEFRTPTPEITIFAEDIVRSRIATDVRLIMEAGLGKQHEVIKTVKSELKGDPTIEQDIQEIQTEKTFDDKTLEDRIR